MATTNTPPAPTPGSLARTMLISEYDAQVLLHQLAMASAERATAIRAIRADTAILALSSLVALEGSLGRIAEITGRIQPRRVGYDLPLVPTRCERCGQVHA
jgi:hypothetical protein